MTFLRNIELRWKRASSDFANSTLQTRAEVVAREECDDDDDDDEGRERGRDPLPRSSSQDATSKRRRTLSLPPLSTSMIIIIMAAEPRTVHQHSSGLQIHSIGSLWNKFANRVAAAAMRMRATVGHARHCYSRRLLQLLLPLGGMQRKSQNHHSARPSHLPKSASARKATKAFGNLRVAAEGKETEGRQTRKIDQCQSLHLSYSTSNKLCLPLWQIHATKLMRCI